MPIRDCRGRWNTGARGAMSLMAVIALFVVVAGFPAGAAAEPGPSTWSYNTSGNVIHHGDEKAIWPIMYAVAAQPDLPLSIGLQEVCFNQAFRFLGFLIDQKNPNYRMAFRKQATCSNGQDYGIAVYAIGDAGASSGTFKYQAKRTRDGRVRDRERRGWVCLKSVYLYHACTAHMTPAGTDDTDATNQFREMRDVAKWIAASSGKPVFWGGDFYMTPAGITSKFGSGFFSDNPEGDVCAGSGYRSTIDNGGGRRKVDYVFKTKPVTCSRDAIVKFGDLTKQSDHALLGGYL